jgi:hypothetical protein
MSGTTNTPAGAQPEQEARMPAAQSGGVTLSERRMMACLEAAWEIDALARILPDQVPDIDECQGARLVVRGIAGRLLRLTSLLMSGIGEGGVDGDIEALERIVSLSKGQG